MTKRQTLYSVFVKMKKWKEKNKFLKSALPTQIESTNNTHYSRRAAASTSLCGSVCMSVQQHFVMNFYFLIVVILVLLSAIFYAHHSTWMETEQKMKKRKMCGCAPYACISLKHVKMNEFKIYTVKKWNKIKWIEHDGWSEYNKKASTTEPKRNKNTKKKKKINKNTVKIVYI